MACAPTQAVDSFQLKHCNRRRNSYPIFTITAASSGGSNQHPQMLISEFKFNSKAKLSCRSGVLKETCNASNSITQRAKWSFKLFRCFVIPRSWSFRMVSIYLLCLIFSAEAHEIPLLSSNYGCEHVEKYYGGVAHLRGEELRHELSSLISKHHSLSYKKVWAALKILDAADIDNPEASSEVVEIYSLKVVPKRLAGNPEGWNREHLWPQSYGLLSGPSLTDLHNIRPADVNVNSSRGNKFYGECNADTSHCLRPANKESAPDTETDKNRWAPPLKVRGDIARAIMYMAVCYGFNGSSGALNLQISDSPNVAKREMGMLSTLLKWNANDPPSREEKLRNERICTRYQHNRNPFVDYPEFADLIWKSME